MFKKNESARITDVCKNGCVWRIHAYLVMAIPTFQIKTIKGSHTRTRIRINKFANYNYLARRIKKIVGDNPDINNYKLDNLIMRKCALDVNIGKLAPETIRRKEDIEPPIFDSLDFSLQAMNDSFHDHSFQHAKDHSQPKRVDLVQNKKKNKRIGPKQECLKL